MGFSKGGIVLKPNGMLGKIMDLDEESRRAIVEMRNGIVGRFDVNDLEKMDQQRGGGCALN